MNEESIRIDPRNVEVLSPNKDILMQFMQNPDLLRSQLNLTPSQVENVRALITGTAAGASVKYLSSMIGPELAGAMGGFLGAYLAKRLIG